MGKADDNVLSIADSLYGVAGALQWRAASRGAHRPTGFYFEEQAWSSS